jgi:16S rRNA (guanine527-N7)-methyltransferase
MEKKTEFNIEHEQGALLREIAATTSITLSDQEIEQFESYLSELVEWNKKTNLTSIKGTTEIIIKHFIDSLMVLRFISLEGSLADIGAGAGFPGIPIKIKRPDLDLLLVEPRRKKASFMRKVIRDLALRRAEVYNGRVEELAGRVSFDFVISRALGDLDYSCSISMPLLKTDGCIIAMQGPTHSEAKENDLMKRLAIEKTNAFSYNLPLNMGKRQISLFRKCST